MNLGKQFKAEATAYEYIKMCDERIKSYEGYIANLKELREVKQREKAEEHKDELRVLLASMDDEERTKFIKQFKQMSMDTQTKELVQLWNLTGFRFRIEW